MALEGNGSSFGGHESALPFLLQLALLLLLSLHAVAVGVWGVAFLKDLARGRDYKGALTSAELNRQERERHSERERSVRDIKME